MLMREGVVFNQAYTDCPICIPARTTMITGIESHRYGCPNYADKYRIDRPRDRFLGSLLTAAGYQTCLVGKSHWHTEPSFHAGFETWVQWSRWERERLVRTGRHFGGHGIGANELSPTLSHLPPELCSTDWAVDRSIECLLDRDRTRPLFLWTSMIDPHPGNAIHEPYYSMYDDEDIPSPVHPEWAKGERAPIALRAIRGGNAHHTMRERELRKARGVYYGKITNIDHQLGRLFGALIREGLWDDTVIVFTSDHGEMLGDYGSFFKATFLEGAARIPFLVRFPPHLKGRMNATSPALVGLADLLPTFCDVAGAEIPGDIDGKSLVGLIRGETDAVHEFLHGQIGNQHMFHDGRHKYLYYAGDGRELLFDKASDPLDEHDISDHEDMVAPLRRRFAEHLAAEGHPHVKDGQLVNLGDPLPADADTNALRWMGLVSAVNHP
jgi:arylsulfatase A-like enzyme